MWQLKEKVNTVHSFNCIYIKLCHEFWKVKNYFHKMQAIQ